MKRSFTSHDLAAMLLGVPADSPGSASIVRERLFTQAGVERNQTAKNIHSCMTRLMREVGTRDVLGVYGKTNGKYAAEEWLERAGFAASTKNKYYNAMNSVSNPARPLTARIAELVPSDAREHFLSKAKRNDEALKDRMDENRATDRELDALLPWPDILSAYASRRGGLSPQQALIADLYVGFADHPAGAPRRLDYNRVRVYSVRAPPSPEDNYLVANARTGDVSLSLSEYKTFARRREPIRADLPPGLCASILESLGPKPWRAYLLCKQRPAGPRCEPLTAKALGDQVAATMRALTGKPIPASGLRKSFLTWLHARNLPNASLKEYARNMGHDVATATLYRKLNIDDSRPSESRGMAGGGGCFFCGEGDHAYAACPVRNV